ncbi:MAG: TIGR01459 family HAD-type hydrolase, partial [Boseongicola sp.]|nr:TIGR01459 family HAD-type hydrolase [Boseongicola sp.]
MSTPIVADLAEISDNYDAVFCDLWGCLHNGIEPFPEAVAALQAYRKRGGKVVLLTNAPRPRASVEEQLEQIGVARDCWDVIATSGDSARSALYQGIVGDKVWFMGQDYDLTFFEPIHLVEDPIQISRVPLE